VVEHPLLPNQKNDPLLGCKVLKKVPLCQVANLVEGSVTRWRFRWKEILRVGWGKKWKFIIPKLRSIEVFEKLDAE